MTRTEKERLAVLESQVSDVRTWQDKFDTKFEGYHESMIAALNNVDDKAEKNSREISKLKYAVSFVTAGVSAGITLFINKILRGE